MSLQKNGFFLEIKTWHVKTFAVFKRPPAHCVLDYSSSGRCCCVVLSVDSFNLPAVVYFLLFRFDFVSAVVLFLSDLWPLQLLFYYGTDRLTNSSGKLLHFSFALVLRLQCCAVLASWGASVLLLCYCHFVFPSVAFLNLKAVSFSHLQKLVIASPNINTSLISLHQSPPRVHHYPLYSLAFQRLQTRVHSFPPIHSVPSRDAVQRHHYVYRNSLTFLHGSLKRRRRSVWIYVYIHEWVIVEKAERSDIPTLTRKSTLSQLTLQLDNLFI
ncbi:hypothetical protein K2173_004869 [Erythroxylum novogranatense]|uniref:Uncharacterized protein n=1 Tax=Erythroxylum novogranatense TaxID=1862640 RepID=A0AAV8TBB9_9ROSI|nr:hypothetical protein K2173_004869 [Erythroxylum novogranatense]